MRIQLIKEDGKTFTVWTKSNRRGERGNAVTSGVSQERLREVAADHIAKVQLEKPSALPGS